MIDGLPNPPLRFEQDPESPDGTGTFHFQDGSSLYAHEPELARTVIERSKPLADERLAENAHAAPKGEHWWDAGNFKDEGRTATDAPGPGANIMPADFTQGGGELGGMPAPAPPPAPARQPPADPAAAAALMQRLAQGAPQGQPTAAPAPPPRRYIAGQQGGVVPTTTSTTVESQGAPYSQADVDARADANVNLQLAKMADFDAQRADAERQAAAARAQIPQLQYQEAERRSALGKLDQDYKIERAKVRTIVQEHAKQAHVDPDRFYQKAGTAGVVGMIIGQALGAFSASLGHHENYAQKLIDDEHDREIRAQESEIEAGRIGDNNLLAQLQDQLGDLDQAKSAWKLVQGDLLDAQIRDFASSAKSAEAERSAALWLALNQQDRLLEEQRFRDLSIGKQTVKTDAKVVPTTRGGYETEQQRLARETKELKAKAAYSEAENEFKFQQHGGKQAGELAERAAKGDASAQKSGELYVEGYGQAKTKDEAISLRAAVAEHEAREKTLARMQELNKTTAAGVPLYPTEAKVEAEVLANRYRTSLARSFGGPITESDLKTAAEVTPDPTSWFTGSQEVKIKAAREASRDKLNADIRAIVSGNHAELPSQRKGDK